MGEVEESDSLRKLLETKCPDLFIKDDDIKKLVAEGISAASTIASCSKDDLLKVLPGRLGIVNVLVKTFGEPQRPAEIGPSLKRSRIGNPTMQSFAQSAAKHYIQWEEAEKAGVEMEGHMKFLAVSADPFGDFPGGFLLWIRKCYKDLKEILVEAKESRRFILLGTAGIGKSLFTLFWICYRATLKEKVVWKLSETECYLLDFSEESSLSENATASGPFGMDDPELRVVFDDPNAWLVIDGRQSGRLGHKCHILQACSAKRENFWEFSKNGMTSTRYVPVWSEEEINEFLDDFEVLKVNYPYMDVPTKEQAKEYFGKLGGVPRYVLRAGKFDERFAELKGAVNILEKEACLKLFSGTFEEKGMSDCLVHIKCRDRSYEIKSMFYDFASSYVHDEFGKRLNYQTQ